MDDNGTILAGCTEKASSGGRAAALLDKLAEQNKGRRAVVPGEEEGKDQSRAARSLNTHINSLAAGKADLLVATASEIPLNIPAGLYIAAIPKRGNPFNVLVSARDMILEEQPDDVPIVVADPASRGQLLYYRPGLMLVDIKDDFGGLVRRMLGGGIGGFVTDADEVEAFGGQEMVAEVFTSSICMPAAGQGAMAILVRKEDERIRTYVETVNDMPSRSEIMLERMVLEELDRNGKGPFGVLASVEEDEFMVSAVIVAPDGSEKLSGAMQGWYGEEKEIAEKLARQLFESGGGMLVRKT